MYVQYHNDILLQTFFPVSVTFHIRTFDYSDYCCCFQNEGLTFQKSTNSLHGVHYKYPLFCMAVKHGRSH
jgi:hypothetical protein